MTMTLENYETLKEIVTETVNDMFRDMIETGQGIGTSDLTACKNACVMPVNGRFDIDLNILSDLIHLAIFDIEYEVYGQGDGYKLPYMQKEIV